MLGFRADVRDYCYWVEQEEVAVLNGVFLTVHWSKIKNYGMFLALIVDSYISFIFIYLLLS
jgi:hypothetical protein